MSRLQLFDPELNDPIEAMFKRFMAPMRLDQPMPPMAMRLDVSEKDDAYIIKADLPGVKKEDINIRIEGNVVHIEAQAKQEKEVKSEDEKVLRSERYYGVLSRTLSLAEDVDEDKATARYENGVLTLELPKKTTSTAKHLTIQ